MQAAEALRDRMHCRNARSTTSTRPLHAMHACMRCCHLNCLYRLCCPPYPLPQKKMDVVFEGSSRGISPVLPVLPVLPLLQKKMDMVFEAGAATMGLLKGAYSCISLIKGVFRDLKARLALQRALKGKQSRIDFQRRALHFLD